MLTLRFDMRAPAGGASTTELYGAAVDMCAWAESRGAVLAVLSEHHGTEDCHLAAPQLLAAAIAARTTTLAILLAAVPIPLWDPVRLAEEICALDIISGGRVTIAFGVGHRAEEYEHFGVDMTERGAIADEALGALIGLLRGREVGFRGRRVRVTPSCATAGGAGLLIAGASRAAVRRAGRFGLGFLAQANSAGLQDFYATECRSNGHEPGLFQVPTPGAPTAVFVADDIESAWSELGPYLLHDAVTAASYRPGDATVASIFCADTIDDLRAPGSPYQILDREAAARYVASGRMLPLLPLCGGLPPGTAWPYLERAVVALETH